MALPLKAQTIVPGKQLKVVIDSDSSHLNKKIKYKWGTDPFYKTPGFVARTKKRKPLKLEAVLHSNNERSLAVINGKTVFVNTIINGYVVKNIGTNFVVVKKNNSLIELQLQPIENKILTDIDYWDRLPASETK